MKSLYRPRPPPAARGMPAPSADAAQLELDIKRKIIQYTRRHVVNRSLGAGPSRAPPFAREGWPFRATRAVHNPSHFARPRPAGRATKLIQLKLNSVPIDDSARAAERALAPRRSRRPR
ncbi:hypothetical protein EVAR_43232_1 [Eumeta japonica]|uniref:Uncharacterized protein n=1 Tax=Eumeta variegata TaxID=151549 RepID=A0A4C1WVR5_EUMVA|nr:hypothetical protein EVAR_43232_1 [Eumeta japonica]